MTGAEPCEEVAPQTSTLSSIRRLNPVQRQEFIHGSSIDECQSVQAVNAGNHIFAFDLVQTAGRNFKRRLTALFRNVQTRCVNVTKG